MRSGTIVGVIRRPVRYSLTFVNAASLALCVAMCVIWVRSFDLAYGVGWARKESGGAGIVISRGAAVASWGPPEARGGARVWSRGFNISRNPTRPLISGGGLP